MHAVVVIPPVATPPAAILVVVAAGRLDERIDVREELVAPGLRAAGARRWREQREERLALVGLKVARMPTQEATQLVHRPLPEPSVELAEERTEFESTVAARRHCPVRREEGPAALGLSERREVRRLPRGATGA